MTPKRIIFILVDTLRADYLGLYGKNPTTTPYIDEIGKKSVLFTNCYASITKTDPSITSIMSGLYPLSIGLINQGKDILSQEENQVKKISLLTEILKKNGYKTIAIDWLGRWHKRGYDYYSGKLTKDFAQVDKIFDSQKMIFINWLQQLDKANIKFLSRDLFSRFYYYFFQQAKPNYDDAETIVKKAIQIIKRNKNNKVFIYLHFWDPHIPHTRSRDIGSSFLDSIEDSYAKEVAYADKNIGVLINYLKETSKLRDTLLIFTSDHGENFYSGIPLNHDGLYEEVIRVPFFFFHESFSQNRISALVQHIDILPTILDILDIAQPKDIDGKSLLPIIKGKKEKIHDKVYFEDIPTRQFKFYKNIRKRGIINGDYKYIQTLSSDNYEMKKLIIPLENTTIIREELYDLKYDPLEKNNLVKKKKSIVDKLRFELIQEIENCNKKRLLRNTSLHTKILKSVSILKKAIKIYGSKEIAIAWTGGKDSTVLLHLVRLAFGGRIPFKVIFNDSTMEFEEIYKFITRVKRLWNIDLITIKHSQKELEEFYKTKDMQKKKELSRLMKITVINKAIKKYKLKGFMAGIRWDEHVSRSKETYFSKRKDHIRIHPILHFKEKDIWEYINFFGVPYVELYDKGYRSLGEKPFTSKALQGAGERSGREREKEELMSNLRRLGYW